MTPFPVLPGQPDALVDAALPRDGRLLLVGAPGTGKSTLATRLAAALASRGRFCRCIGADPGSPAFGIPGAVSRARWDDRWEVEAMEALCTLDAGRFRLPLTLAVARLAAEAPAGPLLVDGPGVVRGVAGAELLAALAEAAGVNSVLVLARAGRIPLAAELRALPATVFVVEAADAAQRPGKAVRARRRTEQWDAYLAQAVERTVALEGAVLGTPPPVAVPAAWVGRQVALLEAGRTGALGEVLALEGSVLRLRLARDGAGSTLLVRDAQRQPDGRLGTAPPFAAEPLHYLGAPEMRAPGYLQVQGPRPTGRVGALDVALVNGVFGDPLLHVRLRHRRRSLLFDLGEGTRLPARIAHQVSDVFVTHGHVDHIAGFLWLLRSRIGESGLCRLYGPPGLAAHIQGFLQAIRWDRVGERGPRFEVAELHGDGLHRVALQGGREHAVALEPRPAPDGLLLEEDLFRVRAAVLDHVQPVLAFALEPPMEVHVRKDRLLAERLAPGPWLGELKQRAQSEELDGTIRLPDGRSRQARALAEALLFATPGRKLTYATDFSDTEANRRRLVALARGSHTFFCEASFLERDRAQAQRTAHITTRACGEIAAAAGVARLVPFHFSRRYEHDVQPLYEEIAAVCPQVVAPTTLGAE